ncbi:MAG: helix-turn-helix domain-containing protein [Dehalococcoidales bacterium]|nr:helix-turn-helix domain-containing protein [Dehalococcoidales bacterium]
MVRSFGEAMREERERRGWSKNELARRSGLDPSYIYRLETGRVVSPSIETVRRVADALGLTPRDLLGPQMPSTVPPSAPRFGPVVLVPLVNISLAAGQTIYGETRESVPVPAELVPGRTLVAARITGECMEPEIKPGDTAIVDVSARAPRIGDLVAVLMEDGSMNVKRFDRDRSGPVLIDNKGGQYRPNGAKIQGVVVYVGRTYR